MKGYPTIPGEVDNDVLTPEEMWVVGMLRVEGGAALAVTDIVRGSGRSSTRAQG